MAIIKFDIKKYDHNVSFVIWKVKMHAILTQSSLKKLYWIKIKCPV